MNTTETPPLSIFQEGRGKSIISVVTEKVTEIQNSFSSYGFQPAELPPAIRFLVNELKALNKRIETNASEMDRYLEREEIINRKAGLRKIQEIQHLIKKRLIASNSSAAREMQILKMKHAEDLNALISYRHQGLVNRLKIVRDWERILNRELEILDTFKNTLVSKLIETVNQAGDAELINHVRSKLKTMRVSDDVIQTIKSPIKDTHVANIDAITKMVMDNLDTATRIENHIQEKKEFLTQLARLLEEIRRPLPQEMVEEAEQETGAPEGCDAGEEPAKGKSSGGMFSSFRRK